MKLVLASSNFRKTKELSNLLSDTDIDVYSQNDFGVTSAIENGNSFEENALIKAQHCSNNTGLPSLADDSGLEVDYLAGAPGIHSARFAGIHSNDQQNIDKLLQTLDGVPWEKRRAQFVCVITMVTQGNDNLPLVCKGVWKGYINEQPQGRNGFGYDPIFYVDDYKCTSAMLEATVKNQISHRSIALKYFKSMLNSNHYQ